MSSQPLQVLVLTHPRAHSVSPEARCSRLPHTGVGGRVSGGMVDVLTCLRELSHLTQLVTGVKRQRVQGAFERGSRSFWHVIHKSLQFRVIRLPKETTESWRSTCSEKVHNDFTCNKQYPKWAMPFLTRNNSTFPAHDYSPADTYI